MKEHGLGPQHVGTYQVQRYLNRAFPPSQPGSARNPDTRKKNANEIVRFAKYVLGKQVDILKFNKWRNGGREVHQMSDRDSSLVAAMLCPDAKTALSEVSLNLKAGTNQLENLFRSKYKPALEMIIRTGCRPSEALYAANFKQLWTRDGKGMTLTVPLRLSKTGYEQRWKFDEGPGAELAGRLWGGASDALPIDEFHDQAPDHLKYRGLHDYFARVSQTLGLEGYRDASGAARPYSLKFLRRKKAEAEFIRGLQNQRTAVGQEHLGHRSARTTRSYLDSGAAKQLFSLDHGSVGASY